MKKKVSETRWILNVPLFINTFFFFLHLYLFPFPNILPQQICWRRCEKGQKSLLCFSGNCPFSHRTQRTRRNGRGSFFEDPFQSVCVTCEGAGGGGVLGRCEEGLLWSWLGVTTGFLSWEVCKLIRSKLQATISPFLSIQMTVSGWHPSDRKWLSRGENGSVLLPTLHVSPPPSPFLQLEKEDDRGALDWRWRFLFSQINNMPNVPNGKGEAHQWHV